jgi:hypothetical protein
MLGYGSWPGGAGCCGVLVGGAGCWAGGGVVVTGIVADDTGFEVLAGDERVGSRRSVGPADAEFLTGLTSRYARPGRVFLAEDALARFCVLRRLSTAGQPPFLDGFGLGLALMGSSPRGEHELDFETEEAAILGPVGETRVDLMVEDTGDPEQLGQRLAALGGMPAAHLSCHGASNWKARPGDSGLPVLKMEDETGRAGRRLRLAWRAC